MTTTSASNDDDARSRPRGARMPRLLMRMSAVLVAALSTTSAHAQPSEQDRALAQSLFEQGRELMNSDRLDQACPKFAESHRLDPGGGTLLNLAKCYEKAGKIASAWATYEEARALSRRDGRADREQFCVRKLEELKPAISTLTLHVPENARVAGLRVTLGARTLSSAAWGTPLPLDPGEHQIKVSAPGRRACSQVVTIGERADKRAVDVPILDVEPTTTAEAKGPQAPRATTPAPPAAPAPEPEGAPILGYAIAGTGLVALGVGSYFGWRAMSTWDDRKAACDGNACDPKGMGLDADTNRYANYANVGFAVGVVGVGLGSYLILSHGSATSPENEKSKAALAVGATVVPSRLEVGMAGSF